MKEIKFSYNPSGEYVKKELAQSGVYTITMGKKILFTLLCAFIIVNSGYALISTMKVLPTHIMYIVLGVAILAYTWLLPEFLTRRKIKTVNPEEEIEITLKPSELIEIKGGKEVKITDSTFRGKVLGDEIFTVYSTSGRISFPTDKLSREEKAEATELLEYFHNPDYFKSAEEKAADSEPEFEPFVPPDDFVPEDEPTTLENEDAENE